MTAAWFFVGVAVVASVHAAIFAASAGYWGRRIDAIDRRLPLPPVPWYSRYSAWLDRIFGRGADS